MSTKITIEHRLKRKDLALGVVRAENVSTRAPSDRLDAELDRVLRRRLAPLSEREEAVRAAVRDVLRNGRYRPTGRAKPASEYLLRAACGEGGAGFPRINPVVDAANLVSLDTLLPVSLWDVDRAAAVTFRFRLGLAGERYVFNGAGQAIELEDLVVGCRTGPGGGDGEPIVNPVKDSLATKTTGETARVAAVVYAPLSVVPPAELERICAAFTELLAACGAGAEAACGVALPGEAVEV